MRAEGCWVWKAACRTGGYGEFWDGTRLVGAHRFAWELANGPIPDGLAVMHVVCDNPPCVRVDHLALGTLADNNADMTSKGRNGTYDRGGTRNPKARLTEDDVRAIRHRNASGEFATALAREFNVSEGAVQHLLKRRSWTHVA